MNIIHCYNRILLKTEFGRELNVYQITLNTLSIYFNRNHFFNQFLTLKQNQIIKEIL